MKTVLDFASAKSEKRKVSMVTAYDYWTARIVSKSQVDCILVGDSSAMVMHGFPTTLQATVDLMSLHTAAVVRGAGGKFVIADMPFLSFRKGLSEGMSAVGQLMSAGAQAIKLEGVRGHEDLTKHIVESGVPVMGHLGLTPQSVHALGGFKVQAREEALAEQLLKDALTLESLGCFSLVLECVPSSLGRRVTAALKIPTIGIGAGPFTDGQVLVLHDLLGFQTEFKPKFLRTYLDGEKQVTEALNHFARDVNEGQFPSEQESYS